jgi:integrase
VPACVLQLPPNLPPSRYPAAMAARRPNGEGAITFEHTATCTDPTRHRSCAGRWRGELTTGYSAAGKRMVRKVSGHTKTEVSAKLKKLREDITAGVKPAPAHYNMTRAAEDFLRDGLKGRSPRTVRKNLDVLTPLLKVIGSKRVPELTVADVEQALASMATTYSSASVVMGHNALTRTLRHAQARDIVGRNVATLVDTPEGQAGRPSKSLTPDQVVALLTATEGTWMQAYIAISVGAAMRTEEVRVVEWPVIDFGAKKGKNKRPASVQILRSVRAGGEVKTHLSRRTVELPAFSARALLAHQERTGGATTGLVFATRTGRPLDAANVRREFRNACIAAHLDPDEWTPRELRHTGVSLMSLGGVRLEEISRIAGHASTRTTEVVYRKELRPVLRAGAGALDDLIKDARKPRSAA